MRWCCNIAKCVVQERRDVVISLKQKDSRKIAECYDVPDVPEEQRAETFATLAEIRNYIRGDIREDGKTR